MQHQNGNVNIALWVIVALCAVFIVLWVSGVGFFRPEPQVVQVSVEPEEDDLAPMPRREHAKSSDNAVLPPERVVIDDGRDPDAPLL